MWEQSERPWKVCAEILQGDISALSGEALLFFVNVIHKKLRHDYAQLPGSAPAELRQVILRAIFNVHKAISSNASNARGLRKAAVVLGACIAALALHMRGSGAWPDPAADTIASFREAGAPGYALEALAKMPEEATSQDVCVGRPQRDAFNVYLSDAVPGVFRFLTETLKGSGADVGVQEAAFQCIYAWLKYCTFSYDDLKASPIVPALFLGLSHPALFSVAVDAICEAVSVAG